MVLSDSSSFAMTSGTATGNGETHWGNCMFCNLESVMLMDARGDCIREELNLSGVLATPENALAPRAATPLNIPILNMDLGGVEIFFIFRYIFCETHTPAL